MFMFIKYMLLTELDRGLKSLIEIIGMDLKRIKDKGLSWLNM
jgi:hypothetical protein